MRKKEKVFQLQGGSDISGTLSKLHSPLKNHLFKKLFRAQASQLLFKAQTKTIRNERYCRTRLDRPEG
jgi:hypothetical protein